MAALYGDSFTFMRFRISGFIAGLEPGIYVVLVGSGSEWLCTGCHALGALSSLDLE